MLYQEPSVSGMDVIPRLKETEPDSGSVTLLLG